MVEENNKMKKYKSRYHELIEDEKALKEDHLLEFLKHSVRPNDRRDKWKLIKVYQGDNFYPNWVFKNDPDNEYALVQLFKERDWNEDRSKFIPNGLYAVNCWGYDDFGMEVRDIPKEQANELFEKVVDFTSKKRLEELGFTVF